MQAAATRRRDAALTRERGMPFSHSGQISAIVGEIERAAPASVLDVGAGMGQYGFLARVCLENVGLFDVDGAQAAQRPRERWRVRIDGIEGCAIYLTPVHAWAYDRMMVGDALELLPGIADRAYEMVLAIDILEHFDVADGERFLAHLRRIASRVALVSTPKQFIEQHVEANPYEDHRSLWSDADLARCGFGTIVADPVSWIALHRAA